MSTGRGVRWGVAAAALAVVGVAAVGGPQRPAVPQPPALDLTPLAVSSGPAGPLPAPALLPTPAPAELQPAVARQEPQPGAGGAPGVGAPPVPGPPLVDPVTGERPLVVPLNQRLVIRPEGVKGKVAPEQVVVDRPELFAPVPVGKGLTRAFALLPDGVTLQLVGVKLGTARIRVFNPEKADEKPYTVTVQVVPDVDYLNRLVRARFPNANIVVSAAGDNFLFADGAVENPADVEAVEDLLKKFFTGGVVNNVRVAGVMQVQLEVVIARVDRTLLRQLGFNFLLNTQSVVAGTQVGNLISTPSVSPVLPGGRVFAPIGPNQAPLNGAATAFFGVTDQNRSLYGFIEALRQQNVAKVLANPTLVTFSGRQADFLVGGEQPIPVAGTITAPTVNFKAFGTRLTFLPTVLGGGKIRLDVVPEVSTTNFANAVNVGGLQVPQFIVQRLHATVELQSGQTLCLGGLLQTQVEAQSQKVPVLGELPGVGALFRRVRHNVTESELLVLVTPRLFSPLDACQAPAVLPGQQTVSPTDAQLFGLGAIESAGRNGESPIGPHHVPALGDLIGPQVVPVPVSSCPGGAYRTLTDCVCPIPAATLPAAPVGLPAAPPATLPAAAPAPEPTAEPAGTPAGNR